MAPPRHRECKQTAGSCYVWGWVKAQTFGEQPPSAAPSWICLPKAYI